MSKLLYIGAYKAKQGLDSELEVLLAQHYPLLQKHGLVSPRPGFFARSENQTYIEIFEWLDTEKCNMAHQIQDVTELWQKMKAVSGIVTLSSLPEIHKPFAGFNSIEIAKEKLSSISFEDTMIPAKNYTKLVQFYKDLLGLYPISEASDFTLLADGVSSQTLCITNGVSSKQASPGIRTENLEDTLRQLQNLGGRVLKKEEFQKFKYSNCEDIEGNELLIWQNF